MNDHHPHVVARHGSTLLEHKVFVFRFALLFCFSLCFSLFFSLFFSLSLSSDAVARATFPYHLSTPGDRSVVRLKVSNIGSAPRTFQFGPLNGARSTHEIEAYESQEYFFQCVKRNDLQSTPELLFTLGQEDQRFDSWDSRASDPHRLIWNRGAPQTPNRMKWSLRGVLQSLYRQSVISTRADTMLSEISVWSKTQLFMTSLKALSDLSVEQRRALKIMVAMGTTLVIGTGDMEGDESLLQEFASVGLGEVKSNSQKLLEQLPRASSYRMLFPQNEARSLVVVDHEPIVVESSIGLGKVRVLAVRLNELTSSPISTRALKSDASAKLQLQEWLDLAMPPLTAPHRLLNDQVWLLIFLIPLIFRLSQRRWRFFLMGSVAWVGVALINPPLFAPTSIRQAHMLYIPIDGGAVAIAQADLNSFDRGGRVERLKSYPITLLSTETQGACLAHKPRPVSVTSRDMTAKGSQDQSLDRAPPPHESWLILDSDLGERQRFKYLTYISRIPNVDLEKPEESLPEWPAGPWSGARLKPLKLLDRDMILPVDISGVKAWSLPSQAPHISQDTLILKSSPEEQ